MSVDALVDVSKLLINATSPYNVDKNSDGVHRIPKTTVQSLSDEQTFLQRVIANVQKSSDALIGPSSRWTSSLECQRCLPAITALQKWIASMLQMSAVGCEISKIIEDGGKSLKAEDDFDLFGVSDCDQLSVVLNMCRRVRFLHSRLASVFGRPRYGVPGNFAVARLSSLSSRKRNGKMQTREGNSAVGVCVALGLVSPHADGRWRRLSMPPPCLASPCTRRNNRLPRQRGGKNSCQLSRSWWWDICRSHDWELLSLVLPDAALLETRVNFVSLLRESMLCGAPPNIVAEFFKLGVWILGTGAMSVSVML